MVTLTGCRFDSGSTFKWLLQATGVFRIPVREFRTIATDHARHRLRSAITLTGEVLVSMTKLSKKLRCQSTSAFLYSYPELSINNGITIRTACYPVARQ